MDNPKRRNHGLFKCKNQKTFYAIAYSDIWLIFLSFLTQEWDILPNSATELWMNPQTHSPLVLQLYHSMPSIFHASVLTTHWLFPLAKTKTSAFTWIAFHVNLEPCCRPRALWAGYLQADLKPPSLMPTCTETPFLLAGPPWVWLLGRFSRFHTRLNVLPAFTMELVSPTRGWGCSKSGSLVLPGFEPFYSWQSHPWVEPTYSGI